MKALREDLKRYGIGGIVAMIFLSLIAAPVLVSGLTRFLSGSYEQMAIFVLLALILGITSAKHALRFLGTGTGTSVSEVFTFLSVMLLGPFQAALLAATDALLACRRLKVRPGLYLFNIANHAIAF